MWCGLVGSEMWIGDSVCVCVCKHLVSLKETGKPERLQVGVCVFVYVCVSPGGKPELLQVCVCVCVCMRVYALVTVQATNNPVVPVSDIHLTLTMTSSVHTSLFLI